MSARWKPGTVAMVTFDNASGAESRRGETDIKTVLSLRCDNDWWAMGMGVGLGAGQARHIIEIRPLVVIDPEDRDAVERLLMLVYPLDASVLKRTGRFDHLQDALREFANPTPPRPEEPTVPLTVVEGGDGRKWYRMPWPRAFDYAWAALNGSDEDCDWSDIPAPVRVLSEGIGEVAGNE